MLQFDEHLGIITFKHCETCMLVHTCYNHAIKYSPKIENVKDSYNISGTIYWLIPMQSPIKVRFIVNTVNAITNCCK